MPAIDNYTLRRLLEKTPQVGVESRCVASVAYDEISFELDVTFVGPPDGGSGTWRYSAVPLATYVDFMEASSLGQYFNLYIRNQFSGTRIS